MVLEAFQNPGKTPKGLRKVLCFKKKKGLFTTHVNRRFCEGLEMVFVMFFFNVLERFGVFANGGSRDHFMDFAEHTLPSR